MKTTNPVFTGGGITIFEVMSRLAAEHNAVNLGQGFPDGNGPDDVREKAQLYLADRPNQYPSAMGDADLRKAVADHDKRFYGLEVNPMTEVVVGSGATEVLAASLLGLLEPGDEAILLEPSYDSYLPMVRLAGAAAKRVRLTPPHWDIPRAELAAAFNARTKLIVLNSPMNPCGKVFTREELSFIAELMIKHDTYAVCDEVYEHIIYSGHEHIPLIALSGMRERCIKIGSAGKTFSLTGWKVGYATAAPALLTAVAKTHQFLTFTTPPNLQRAVAYGLNKDDSYYKSLAGDLAERCDFLASGLKRIGFDVLGTGGSYFTCVDIRPLEPKLNDADFCRKLTIEAGVTAIPLSAFYAGEAPTNYVRFAFCKTPETLREALARLEKYFRR